MESDSEEGSVDQSAKQLWITRESSNPYRDDPREECVTDLVIPSTPPAKLHKPTTFVYRSVCTCGGCIQMECEEDQKCCHEIPNWKNKYGSNGKLILQNL